MKDIFIISYIKQMATQQTSIEYKVKDASKYQGEKQGLYKQISHINQKSKDFIFISQQQKFEIQLILKVPAIITTINYNVKSTNQISFDLYRENKIISNVSQIIPSNQINIGRNRSIKLQQKSDKFDKVVVRFLNYDQPKKTCINHIMLKGFKQQNSQKKVIKNVSQNDLFQHASKKKVGEQQKKVFNLRNRQRKVTAPQDLIKQIQQQQYLKSGRYQKQDQQLQKALELSKKQYTKQLKKSKQNKEQKQNKDIEEQNKPQFPQFYNYETVQFNKIKKTFEHVTPQWIQAQKKAERQKDIQNIHSLADKIKLKIFKQQTFCINNILGSQKSKLITLINQLGGKYIQQPQQKTIVITNRMEGAIVSLAKKLNKASFVRPQYLHDCDKTKSRLEAKHYQP